MFKKLIVLALCGWMAQPALAAKRSKKSNKTKTKRSKVVKQQKESPWGFSFISENYANGTDLEIGDAARTINLMYATLSYKLTDKTTIGFRQFGQFDYYTNESLQWGDSMIRAQVKHDQLNGGWDFNTEYRLYFPVSEYAQALGRHRARIYATVSTPITKTTTFAFQTNPRIMAYTKHQNGQRGLKWKNHIQLGWTPAKPLTILNRLGHAHYNYYTGGPTFQPNVAPQEFEDRIFFDDDAAYYELEVVGKLTDSLSLIGMISQEHDLRSGAPVTFLRPEETTYFIIGVLSI